MPITEKNIAAAFLILIFFGALIFPTILIMHLSMPKAAIKKYFKPPHFSYRECAVFSAYPLFFMRTAMFMAVFAFPSRGKKRQMTDAYLLAPNWYRIASKWIFIIFISDWVILLILGAALSVYMYFDPTP